MNFIDLDGKFIFDTLNLDNKGKGNHTSESNGYISTHCKILS